MTLDSTIGFGTTTVKTLAGTIKNWILTCKNGNVLSGTLVQKLTNYAENTTSLVERVNNPDHISRDENGDLLIPDNWDDPEFIEQIIEEFGRPINDPSVQEVDQDFTSPDACDETYLNMELALPRDGAEVQFGQVIKRPRDKDGLTIWNSPQQPNPQFEDVRGRVSGWT